VATKPHTLIRHSTNEELLDAMFSLGSIPKTQQSKCFLCGPIPGYISEDNWIWFPAEIFYLGPTIVGTGNSTPEVPELPSAWGDSWATLSPGVINTERQNAGEGQQQIFCTELKQFRWLRQMTDRPLVRGGAWYRQNSNCQRVINIWSWAPDRARNRDALTDWSSVIMWLWHSPPFIYSK
jgi:hypothetical protein